MQRTWHKQSGSIEAGMRSDPHGPTHENASRKHRSAEVFRGVTISNVEVGTEMAPVSTCAFAMEDWMPTILNVRKDDLEPFKVLQTPDCPTPVDERIAHALEYIAKNIGIQTAIMIENNR
jgi:hypothetical protein